MKLPSYTIIGNNCGRLLYKKQQLKKTTAAIILFCVFILEPC